MTTRYVGCPTLSGFASGTPEYFDSIAEASEWLREQGDPYFLSVYEERDSILLYRVTTPEAIESAEEFAGIGNPFDYPSAALEFGPRGGIRRVHV